MGATRPTGRAAPSLCDNGADVDTLGEGGIMPDDEKRPQARREKGPEPRDPFIRAENEDDDGYDPYSDRRPEPEPLFERDPWG